LFKTIVWDTLASLDTGTERGSRPLGVVEHRILCKLSLTQMDQRSTAMPEGL
jgi:hypothetical protein